MRRLIYPVALTALAIFGTAPALAQQTAIQLPEYTVEQRWQRLATGTVWWQAALVELGRQQGMTAEEVGAWVGDFFTQGWLGGAEASQYVISLNRNHMSWPEASLEVLSSTPTTVKARLNRPWDAVIGRDRQIGGVTTADFDAMVRASEETLANWVGVDLTWEEDGGQDVLSFRTEYGPIQASNDLRWARGAYLSWNATLQLLQLQMESGQTAREAGLAAGKLYGPGWGSTTPWQLFRGMTWNAMTDPELDCEVLSASPQEVRARCAITYAERVQQGSAYFSVTLEDVLENWRAFAESVAEQRGMRWEESWSDGYRMIRVTMR